MSKLYYTLCDRCPKKKFKTSTAVRKHCISAHNEEFIQSEFKFKTREGNQEWSGVPIPQLITEPANLNSYLEWLTAWVERINGSFTPSLQGKGK